MKKLFFVALMASIAVGGAYATSENKNAPGNLWISTNGTSTPDYVCEGGFASCEGKFGGEIPTLYDSPLGSEPRTEVHLDDFTYTP